MPQTRNPVSDALATLEAESEQAARLVSIARQHGNDFLAHAGGEELRSLIVAIEHQQARVAAASAAAWDAFHGPANGGTADAA